MTIGPKQSLPGSPIHRAELVWGHPDLEHLAIAVGQYLLTRCGNRDGTYVSSARVQHDLKISDRTARRAMKQLKAIGLFRVEKRRDNLGWNITVSYDRADIERERDRYAADIKQAKATDGEPSDDQRSGPSDQTSTIGVRSAET